MALLFTGTDDFPYNPYKTDEVCAFTGGLVDWNITQNPDPVTYASLIGDDPQFDFAYKPLIPIIDSVNDGSFRFSDGDKFYLDTGPLQSFLGDAVTMGNEITDSLNAINPHLSGDLKNAGSNFNANGFNFNSVAGSVLGSNTYQDFARELNEDLNSTMTALGILDKDKWNFKISLDAIPEDETVEVVTTFHYEWDIHKQEFYRVEGGWLPKCGLGVKNTLATNAFATLDLTTGELVGGVGTSYDVGAYVEFLDSDGRPNGWEISVSTGAGHDSTRGWYGPGDITWMVGKSVDFGRKRQ
tara:strand:+ start:1333 stop:2226 length:894 start_codon:yes stop_codon:yes gene_type:complete